MIVMDDADLNMAVRGTLKLCCFYKKLRLLIFIYQHLCSYPFLCSWCAPFQLNLICFMFCYH
jgi:hypothetical protein